MKNRNWIVMAAASVVGFGLQSVIAAPYAAQITESGQTVNYILSEDADEIVIVENGVVTSTLGATTAGAQSFTKGAGTTNYQIIARKNSANGYMKVDFNNAGTVTSSGVNGPQGVELQVGLASGNIAQQFELPRDVAINTNPATPALFGRTYVLQPRTANTASGRATTEGIYILNADRTQHALNPGDTALTGGVAFDGVASNIVDLFKVALDADGNVYVSDWSDPATPGVRTWDPDISTGGNLLVGTGAAVSPPNLVPTETQNHGSVGGLALTGSATNGTLKLFTIDEDMEPVNNSVFTYNLGSSRSNNPVLPTAGASALLTASVINDLEVGTGGRLYVSQNRTDGLEGSLYLVTPDGSTITYNSLTDSRLLGIDGNTAVGPGSTPPQPVIQDVVRGVQGIAVSPDGKWLATSTNIGGDGLVIPLIEGVPDIANRALIDLFTGSTGTDVSFDAANNLYAANRSTEEVRVFSPGGVSHTIYNSAGTFKVVNGAMYDGSGNLSDSSKYAFGVTIPTGVDGLEGILTIGALSTGAQTLNVDGQQTISRVIFAGGDYTVSGSGSLDIGTAGGFDSYLEGRIIAESGNHTVNARVNVTQNFGVAAYTGSSLTLTDVAYANGQLQNDGSFIIQKFGGGTVTMPVFAQRLLVVRDGTLKFSASGGVSAAKVNALSISGTTAGPTGTLDLASGGLVVDYASDATVSPLADLTALVLSGVNGGNYAGKGITSSSAAAASNLGVGIAEASTLPTITTFLGQPVADASAVLIRTSLKGDGDLNGTVNFDDLLSLAQSYDAAGTGKLWTDGDSNYDGTVDFDDLLSLAQNYGGTFLNGVVEMDMDLHAQFAGDWTLALSMVPEPTSLTALALGGLMLRRRR